MPEMTPGMNALLPSRADALADTNVLCRPIYDFPLGYIGAEVNGRPVRMLVDSACSYSTMDLTVYLSLNDRPPLHPFAPKVNTVDNNLLCTHGYCTVRLKVEDLPTFEYELVVADIGRDETIFGFNLMKRLGAVLDTGADSVTVAGQTYDVGPCKGVRVAALRSCRAVTVKPMSTMSIRARVDGEWESDALGMMTPGVPFQPSTTGGQGLLLNPALVAPEGKECRVEVTNLSELPRRMPKDQPLGTVEEVFDIVSFGRGVPDEQPTQQAMARVLSTVARGQCPAQLGRTIADVLASPEPLAARSIVLGERLVSVDECELPKHLEPLMDTLSKELNTAQRRMVKALLLEYADVFTAPGGELGHTTLVQHTIDVGEQRPIKQAPRRASLHSRVIIDEAVKDMLKQGVIEPSTSPWASPVVLVRKKDGSHRFCVDYRQLNEATVKDAYPLPRLDDSLVAMGGAQWFSTLDLHSGYWQVEMAEGDKEKTAFATRMGLYHFTVMPFGLTNTPATFERLMELVLSGMPWEQLQVSLDDVIVFGATFLIALLNLALVFERFRKAKLKMKVKKCALFQESVAFLGHVVGRDGVHCDPEKIAVVQDWPHPQTVTEVRSFLGFATYYRKFIPEFSTIASPLTNLTRKDVGWEWTVDCEAAFRALKNSLMYSPVLAYPRMEGQYILDTDASNTGIGGVLSQIQDGEEKVVAYGSKTLSKSQRDYCTTYKELWAVVFFCKHFKHYILGTSVIIRTDHASLVWLRNFKEPEGMLARWITTLNTYNIKEIQHRAGAKHVNADALSRRAPVRPCPRVDCPCCLDARVLRAQRAAQGLGVKGKPRAVRKKKAVPAVAREATDTARKSVTQESGPPPVSVTWDGGALKAARGTGVTESCVTTVLLESEEGTPCAQGSMPYEEPVPLPRRKSVYRPEGLQRRSRRRQTHKYVLPVHSKVSPKGRSAKTSPTGWGGARPKASLADCCGVAEAECVYSRVAAARGTQATRTEEVGQRVEAFAERTTLGDWQHRQQADPDVSAMVRMKESLTIRPGWKDVSGRSAELKAYWTLWDQMFVEDGVLWRQSPQATRDGEKRIVVPPSGRTVLLGMVHDHQTAGHLGVRKTYARVKQRFYWPGCKTDVGRWCQRCHQCALIKPGGEQRRAPLNPQLVGSPMERIAADLIGPLPLTKNGHRYILVVSCYYTKWTEAFALEDKSSQGVADCLVNHIFSRFGVPRQFHTDQGGEFTSDVIRDVCELLHISKTRTSPYRPSSDGLVERANRTLQNMIRAYVNEERNNWDEDLSLLLMAYRSTEQESTGCSPNLMMLGREVETPMDVQHYPGAAIARTERCGVQYAEWLRDSMRAVHRVARANLQKAAKRQKRNYDGRAKTRRYSVGDWVYYQDFRNSHVKLGLKWKGPYLVIGRPGDVNLTLQLGEASKPITVHMDQVKTCHGLHDDSWLVPEPDPEPVTIVEGANGSPPESQCPGTSSLEATGPDVSQDDPPAPAEGPEGDEIQEENHDSQAMPVQPVLRTGLSADAPVFVPAQQASDVPRTRSGRVSKPPERYGQT